MKLTIEELADKINEIIAEKLKDNPEVIKDGRQSHVLSARRIRDYITKGMIEKPVGNGREKWFDESHVNALVSIRMLQHNGLSDQYILSSTKTEGFLYQSGGSEDISLSNSIVEQSNADEEMQSNALNFLKGLQPNNSQKLSSVFANSPSKMYGATADFSNSSLKNSLVKESDANLLKALIQAKYRQFNEYCIEENLGVFLKVDSKLDMELQKKLMETLKKEITNHTINNNIKETKNG